MAGPSSYPAETHGGITTSWLSVQSPWPLPSGCESSFWKASSILAAWDPGYGLSVDSNVRCLPPAATSWWDQNRSSNSLTRISLGPIACPESFRTAVRVIENISSTFVACCPPNYTFNKIEDDGTAGQCSSLVPAGEVINYAMRNQQQTWFTTSTTHDFPVTVIGIAMNGYNIAPQSTSSSATFNPSTLAISTSATTNTITTSIPHSSSGLSTGTKAGIAVGIILGVLALGALIVFVFVHRKKRSTDSKRLIVNSTGVQTDSFLVSEVDSWAVPDTFELDSREVPVELPSKYKQVSYNPLKTL